MFLYQVLWRSLSCFLQGNVNGSFQNAPLPLPVALLPQSGRTAGRPRLRSSGCGCGTGTHLKFALALQKIRWKRSPASAAIIPVGGRGGAATTTAHDKALRQRCRARLRPRWRSGRAPANTLPTGGPIPTKVSLLGGGGMRAICKAKSDGFMVHATKSVKQKRYAPTLGVFFC